MKRLLVWIVMGTLIIGAVFLVGCAAQKETVVPPKITIEQYSRPTLSERNDLDSRLADLTQQIVNSLTKKGKTKIAVIEFSDLDGNITEFGKYLSEELITRLFTTERFEVIERQLLNKVLEEHKLTLTGLIDEASAKELGKILGVDAIASGSVTDLGASVKVNARLISTETGSVFAVAAVKIVKDETVQRLMEKVSAPARISTEKPRTGTVTSGKTTKAGKIFFKEDFSEVEEGMIPEGWFGGDKLMVKSDGRQKFLTNFEGLRSRTKQSFTVDNVKFPKNFRFEWTYQQLSGADHWVDIGELHIFVGMGWAGGSAVVYRVGESQKVIRGGRGGIVTNFAIEKRGDVFRLFVYGNDIMITRHPNFGSPSSFSFKVESDFRLYKIVGTDLGKL